MGDDRRCLPYVEGMTDTPLELVQEPIRIPSVNPELVAGAAGESELARLLAARGGAIVCFLEPRKTVIHVHDP